MARSRRPRALLCALVSAFAWMACTAVLFEMQQDSAARYPVPLELSLVAFCLAVAIATSVLAVAWGSRQSDTRPVIIVALGVLLAGIMGVQALRDPDGYLGSLAGILASLILATAVLRKEDVSLRA